MDGYLPVVGHEGLYEVNASGIVRALKRRGVGNRIIAPKKRKDGYVVVRLSRANKQRAQYLHRVVLIAFAGLPPVGKECAHLDGDKTNNVLSNLVWVTPKVNASHRIAHGTHPAGEKNGHHRVTEDGVRWLDQQRAGGVKFSAIAAKLGIRRSSASNIHKRRSWAFVARAA